MRPVAGSLGWIKTRSLNDRSLSKDELAACASTYQRIIDNRQVEIRLGFGYMDVSDGKGWEYRGFRYPNASSQDHMAYDAMKAMLLSSCSGDLEACDFDQDRRDKNLLTKTIRGPSGEKITAIVRLAHASNKSSYYTNTVLEKSIQEQLSREAEALFFGGIKSADVLIYMGHSRNGGGPDFRPPRLLRDGHPNYAGYYMDRTPGLNALKEAFKKPGQNPILYAQLSCLSEEHFGNQLRRIAPQTGFLLTDSEGNPNFTGKRKDDPWVLTEYDEILQGAFATVDSVLRLQCRTGFRKALDLAKKRVKEGDPERKPKIQMRQFLGTKATNPNLKPSGAAAR